MLVRRESWLKYFYVYHYTIDAMVSVKGVGANESPHHLPSTTVRESIFYV